MNINEQKKLYREKALTQSDINRLPTSHGLDMTVVSEACAEIIRRIHQAMKRLAPMGDDERRSLWFEVKGKKWAWYRISTSVYKDCHYLQIHGDVYDNHVLCNKDNGGVHPWYREDECLAVLSKLEKYMVGFIDNILSNHVQYNAYVEKHLDHYRREGLIRRAILNSLMPDHRYKGFDVAKVIDLYEKQAQPTNFPEMTLRIYMHYWRIAYEAIHGVQPKDDIHVFRNSSKGYTLSEYDLDSEDDFKRWISDVSPYHGFDVVYARVHLFPVNENNRWHLHISTCSYWNLDECLMAVLGLTDAGVSVELGEVAHILGILKETDYVEITPYAYRYMQGDNVGSQMRLPYADEIGKDILKKIIENTEWQKIETVTPSD